MHSPVRNSRVVLSRTRDTHSPELERTPLRVVDSYESTATGTLRCTGSVMYDNDLVTHVWRYIPAKIQVYSSTFNLAIQHSILQFNIQKSTFRHSSSRFNIEVHDSTFKLSRFNIQVHDSSFKLTIQHSSSRFVIQVDDSTFKFPHD